MKAEFLKIAGVKTEKAFYKKYPTEAAFFKAHPEAKKKLKKAQFGVNYTDANGNGVPDFMEGAQAVPNIQSIVQGQMSSPGVNAGMFSTTTGLKTTLPPTTTTTTTTSSTGGTDINALGNKILPYVGAATQVIGGLQGLRAERRAIKEAQKWAKVTGIQAQAAETEDIDAPRQRMENLKRRREAFMPVTTGEEFFPIYGVGTNVLARNGARLQGGGMIGGNPTEIQNTYAPEYTLYDNLGYEPLDDSNQVKQFVYGGGIPKAQTGMETVMQTGTPWGAISSVAGQLGSALTGNNAGSQVGGGLGMGIGTAFGGPIGGAIGSTLGSVAGGLFGQKNQRRLKRAQNEINKNIERVKFAQFRESGPFSASMEDGGQLTNPQLITKFGEYSLKDLLAPDPMMNTLRSGGHLSGNYVPPSASGLSTMEEGGELQTYWGGYAEPMSYNPYLPDGGETVMFRGNSHDEYDGQGNTGIGVSFGNTDEPNVEVERGEPAVKLKDGGTGDENLVVYGNLKIPNYGVDLLGDKNAKGKKFKNYVADLSKTEQKQNKLVENSINQLDALDIRNPFDRLKFASLQANITGGNMKLKEIAEKKIKAADLQNAINDTAEEYGIVADDLARGKVKFDKQATQEYAKYGKTLRKYQNAPEPIPAENKAVTYDQKMFDEIDDLYDKAQEEERRHPGKKNKYHLQLQQLFHQYFPGVAKDIILNADGVTAKAKKMGYKSISDLRKASDEEILRTNEDLYFGPITEQYMAGLNKLRPKRARSADFIPPKVDSEGKKNDVAQDEDDKFEIIKYQQNPWLTALGQILPFIRPTDQEPLDPRQLMGEMYALSTNKLEPVQAQPYSPQLRVPYDISLQDQLNEITADQRATQRMLGYNPAAQANLAAQTFGAKSKVLADQFRANQAMRDQVYAGNIATLNDAQLKNLGIYEQQYVRQAQARSNTKAVAQAALNSISDKYAKNALENRTLGVYENLYNYRYDPAGRAINMNAPFQPVIPQKYNPGNDPNYVLVRDKNGDFKYVRREKVFPTKEETPTVVEETPLSQTNQNISPTMEYVPITSYEDDEGYQDDLINKYKKGGNVKKKKNYSQSSIVRMFK
jgi:hypothetical protein